MRNAVEGKISHRSARGPRVAPSLLSSLLISPNMGDLVRGRGDIRPAEELLVVKAVAGLGRDGDALLVASALLAEEGQGVLGGLADSEVGQEAGYHHAGSVRVGERGDATMGRMC